jgi:CheY-like chemotaxis protein
LTASDGREAVAMYREHASKIVCVLLDLAMPRMDGEDAFREIRLIQPHAKVILCSGYNMPDATERFAGKDLAGFLQKPFDMIELKEVLMETLDDEDDVIREN